MRPENSSASTIARSRAAATLTGGGGGGEADGAACEFQSPQPASSAVAIARPAHKATRDAAIMFMRLEAPLTKSRHFAFRVLHPRVHVRFSCNRNRPSS